MLEEGIEDADLANVTHQALEGHSVDAKLTCHTKGRTFKFVMISRRAIMRETLPGPVQIPTTAERTLET